MRPEEAIQVIRNSYIPKMFTELEEAMEVAIQALEKQVPKKVKNIRFSRDRELAEHNIMEGECPECGETMTGNTFGEYCGSCGIALDWGYEE